MFSLEHIDHVFHSQEMLHHETNINLSDDENEEIDDENLSKIQHSDSDTENDNDDEFNRTVSSVYSFLKFHLLLRLLESKYIIINGFYSC